jgi:hypothetical protein
MVAVERARFNLMRCVEAKDSVARKIAGTEVIS